MSDEPMPGATDLAAAIRRAEVVLDHTTEERILSSFAVRGTSSYYELILDGWVPDSFDTLMTDNGPVQGVHFIMEVDLSEAVDAAKALLKARAGIDLDAEAEDLRGPGLGRNE